MAESHVVVRCSIEQTDKVAERINIEGTNLHAKVSEFRKKVADVVGVRPDEIELVHCGHCMQDERSLDCYGITSGATVLVLKRKEPEMITHEPLDSAAVQKVSSALKIRSRRNFQQVLEKMLDDPVTVNTLTARHQALATDPVALALLQDADLLMMTLIDSTNRLRMLEAHPVLCDAVVQLMDMVGQELGKTDSRYTTISSATRQQYNLDRMDNEDEEEDEEMESMEVNSNQLLTDWSLPTLQPGSVITNDFFQQAMLAATGATPAQPQISEEQLQQLRDMGITDEVLARRALEASGGDIQAALEYIFGDDM